ncbi:MAG TPA: hypothetical protein VMS09_19650 [Paenibacillus sp.]|uniref:hypothetical protein n=1 Tax=Paenibacillus sp. TaxID=58172 RepID=UPI002D171DD9|nr:hypothetical protein [Paenibacillus sp.]HUC94198.1 hypothetical protein [Paenibacillus sp.]
MMERIMVLVAVYGSLIAHDRLHLKSLDKPEKAVYLLLMAGSLYLAVDYAVNRNWINFHDLFEPVFGVAAKQIDAFLKVRK